jgi:hypothetical protein
MFFLFATSTSYAGCSFGGVDANNWVQINALLLTVAIALGGAFYAFSNILPPSQSEKMKGMVKAEIFQGVIGIVIISILLTSAVAWCNIGSSLTSSVRLGCKQPYVIFRIIPSEPPVHQGLLPVRIALFRNCCFND